MNNIPKVELFLEALSATIESFFLSQGFESGSTLEEEEEEEEEEEVEALRAAGRALCLKLCRRRFRKQ